VDEREIDLRVRFVAILLDGAHQIGGGLLPPAQLGMSIPSQGPEPNEFPEPVLLRS
jgi:hypothetical protein